MATKTAKGQQRSAVEKSAAPPSGQRFPKKVYERELIRLQGELVRLQEWIRAEGARLVIVFEGRDAAGKGSTIKRVTQYLNPRVARIAALPAPTERERGQWYFQRYIAHLPTAGDIVFFDRSWYNRAGVERVMGFCSADEVANFLRDVPDFEELLVRDGVRLFKFYLTLGREMQLARFHERRHDPLKRWKLSPIDLAAIAKWDDYTRAQVEMFRYTHTASCPWTVVRANDQRRARLEAIRAVLCALDYKGKDRKLVANPDPLIVGAGPEFFAT
jgi:polyphosphate kinase